MKDLIIENAGLFLSAIATGFGGWFFGRKKAQAETKTLQIENDERLLDHYIRIIKDMGERLDKAIENLEKSEVEKREVIARFNEATETIHQLEEKVERLTEELKKYKQLSGKAP